jgi:hypothetical protein
LVLFLEKNLRFSGLSLLVEDDRGSFRNDAVASDVVLLKNDEPLGDCM